MGESVYVFLKLLESYRLIKGRSGTSYHIGQRREVALGVGNVGSCNRENINRGTGMTRGKTAVRKVLGAGHEVCRIPWEEKTRRPEGGG